MAKRFTDTEKWKDCWFRKLSPNSKVLWFFLTENCDQAGFWKKDYELATFFCGFEVTEAHILTSFNHEKERLINHGNYVQISEFVAFQYGHLSPDCRPHKPIIDLLIKYENKGYQKGINTPKNKTIQEQDKEMDKEKEEEGKTRFNQLEAFNSVACRYPVQIGSSAAMRFFFETVIDDEKFSLFKIALDKYLGSKRVKDGFVLDFNKWIINWSDWINHKEPTKEETSAERDARILAKLKQ